MAYGVQLFDANGIELVDRFVPTFIMDYITAPSSGSQTYPAVQGKTLAVYPLQNVTASSIHGVAPPVVTVEGTSITWSSVSASFPIMVVFE